MASANSLLLPTLLDEGSADPDEQSSDTESADFESCSLWFADPVPVKGKAVVNCGRDFELDFDAAEKAPDEEIYEGEENGSDAINKRELRDLYTAGLWAPRPEFYLPEDDQLDDQVFSRLKKDMVLLTDSNDKDAYVYKRMLHGGCGIVPERSSMVVLHYVAYVEYGDDPVDVAYSRSVKRTLRLQLDNGKALPGFEIAVKSMSPGEWSFFIVSPSLAYGERGCPPRYPGGSEILYFIEFVSILPNDKIEMVMNLAPEERSELSFSTIRSVVNRCHRRVAKCFKMLNFRRAQATQKWLIELLEHCHAADEAENAVRDKLLVRALANGAMIALKTKSPKLALQYTRNALHLDESDSKAHMLRIMAHHALNNFTGALTQCRKALQHHPGDKTLLQLQRKNQLCTDEESEKEKALYRRMMGMEKSNSEPLPVITDPRTETQVDPVQTDLGKLLKSFKNDCAISEVIVDGNKYSFHDMHSIEEMAAQLGLKSESFLDDVDGKRKVRVLK